MASFRWILLLMLLAPTAAWAAEKRPDVDLLEFLGSVDVEGNDWNDYLQGTDIEKVARPAKPAAPPPPPAATAPPPPPPPSPQPEKAR